MQDVKIMQLTRSNEEQMDLYNAHQDAFYKQQDELARLLWEKDHTIRERDF